MNKTTEALKLAEEALEELHYSSGTVKAVTLYKHALAAIREALDDQFRDATKMVAEPVKQEAEVSHGLCGGCAKKAADGWALYCVECWEKTEPVKRPPNCGTGYCSCIECPYEPVAIPDHVTCPFCESDHVPDWLHDLKLDAKAIRAGIRGSGEVCSEIYGRR